MGRDEEIIKQNNKAYQPNPVQSFTNRHYRLFILITNY